jgi:hypothetical protein
MKINVNVKKTFKINGKEYFPLDEMPGDIREIFKKAQRLQAGRESKVESTAIRTKILFNGREFASVDAMPADIRSLYDTVIKAAATEGAADAGEIADIVREILGDRPSPHPAEPVHHRNALAVESSFSSRSLLVGALIIALIVLFYFIVNR